MSGKKIHQTHFTQPEMPWRNKEDIVAIIMPCTDENGRKIKNGKHQFVLGICVFCGCSGSDIELAKKSVELKRERPIIFNAEMVRAILEGRKTQTRRVIKPQPTGWNPLPGLENLWWWCVAGDQDFSEERHCPQGKPGDQLWVRETWAAPGNDYEDCKPSELLKNWFKPEKLKYRATEKYGDVYYKWRPSIHMVRWMSRIQLGVLSVKVERVQDISEADAIAEGITCFVYQGSTVQSSDPKRAYVAFPDKEGGFPKARQAFEALWDSINKKRGFGWDVNPWVWATGFKVIEVKNGDRNI